VNEKPRDAGLFLYAESSSLFWLRRHQVGASARRIEGHIATQELTLRNVTFNATTAAHRDWWMRDSP
jgi:hypothetical protein